MRKRAETDRDGEKDHGVFIGNLAEAGHGDPRLNLKARRQSSLKGSILQWTVKLEHVPEPSDTHDSTR